MKKISFIALIAIFTSLLFTSCKKNEEYNYSPSGGQKIIKFVGVGGFPDNFSNSNVFADASNSAQEIAARLEYSAPTAHTGNISVTIGVDPTAITAYNATVTAATDKYELLPDSLYSIPNKTIVIKAGESLSSDIIVIFDGTKIDPSKNLMLPIKIMSIAGAPADVKQASGTGIAYFHFIGNPLAGAYKITGTRTNYTGAVSGGIISGVTNLTPIGTKIMAPVDPTHASIDYANLGGAGWQYVITYDGTDISAEPNAAMAAGVSAGSYSTKSITYNATTKVIHVVSEYTNGAGNARVVDETWTKQ